MSAHPNTPHEEVLRRVLLANVHGMFLAIVRLIALTAACALPALGVDAAGISGNTVFVESGGHGSSVVHAAATASGSATVDIVTIINGEKVVDIHETTQSEPIDIAVTREVHQNTTHAMDTGLEASLPTAPAVPPHPEVRPPLPPTLATPSPEQLPTRVSERTPVPVSFTNLSAASIEPPYVAQEEQHDDPLVSRILHSVAHTLTYVFTIFF